MNAIVTSVPACKSFLELQFAAFFSYATQDDIDWNNWVTSFYDELRDSLPGRIRIRGENNSRVGVRIHLSGIKPLVAGPLGPQLEANVKDSFAMFLFVHDNYLDSKWCLKELDYFRREFGEQGFLDRLYIIAMSKDAIGELEQRKEWKTLFPYPDQVWMPFFQDDVPDQPRTIYLDGLNQASRRRVATNAFWEPFVKVREHLAKTIRNSVSANKRLQGTTPSEDPIHVRVYIEGDEHQGCYDGMAKLVSLSWDAVVANENLQPPLYIRSTGLPMKEIDKRPFLDDADGVILLWDKKTPDSLLAQISLVEGKLRGSNAAPGMIAFLKEPEGAPPAADRLLNWPVLSFLPDAAGELAVVPQDTLRLGSFLAKVLERKRRRLADTNEVGQ